MVCGASDKDITWLRKRFGSNVRFDEPMANHTSLGIGGPADVFVEVMNQEELAVFLGWAVKNQVSYTVAGNGTNLLVLDQGIRGAVLCLAGEFKRIEEESVSGAKVLIRVGTGVLMPVLCHFAIKNGFAGLNFAIGIPGTLGGGIVMNAGTYLGSLSDVIDKVMITDSGQNTRQVLADEIDWAYRKMQLPETWGSAEQPAIITGCVLCLEKGDSISLKAEATKLLARRKKNQPGCPKNAGSIFKNPLQGPSAGELIDRAGFRGRKVGDAKVAEEHANWIVNTGNAKADDVLQLIKDIQREVNRRFKVQLEPEVRIIGA